MKKLFACLLTLIYFSSYSQISLLKDINAGSGSSNPRQFINLSGTLYFTAFNPLTGNELYKSNNTTSGTSIVKDIVAGNGSSSPEELIKLGSRLIFTAYTPSQGRELWISNGTSAGTLTIKDIFPGAESSSPYNLTAAGNFVYFFIRTESENESGTIVEDVTLWRTDGTSSGTVAVKRFYDYFQTGIMNIGEINGELYFSDQYTIWKSNGTEQGTIAIETPSGFIYDIKSHKGKLYYGLYDMTGDPDGYETELWISDGTPNNGTLLKKVEVFNPQFTSVGNYLYFIGENEKGKELWKTNGTTAGTTLVKDLNTKGSSFPGMDSDFHYTKNGLVASGSLIYFVASNESGERTLYKSNGTAAGTVKIVNAPTFTSNEDVYVESTTSMVYFTHGNSIWKSDGTEAGTSLIKTFSEPVRSLGRVYGLLYIAGKTSTSGNEIWKYTPPTTSTTATVASSEAIQSASFKGEINFSPNTFKTTANLSITSQDLSQPISVKILNLGGKQLSSYIMKSGEGIAVGEDLPSGMFILQVVSGKKYHSQIIIKE